MMPRLLGGQNQVVQRSRVGVAPFSMRPPATPGCS